MWKQAFWLSEGAMHHLCTSPSFSPLWDWLFVFTYNSHWSEIYNWYSWVKKLAFLWHALICRQLKLMTNEGRSYIYFEPPWSYGVFVHCASYFRVCFMGLDRSSQGGSTCGDSAEGNRKRHPINLVSLRTCWITVTRLQSIWKSQSNT